TRTAWSLFPVSMVTTKLVPGTVVTKLVLPPFCAASSKAHWLPAGLLGRPSGSTYAPGALGSAPVRAIAAPVGAVGVHWPVAGVGYLPSHMGQASRCGIVAHAPSAGHAYGVVVSGHLSIGQSYAHEVGGARNASGSWPPEPPVPVDELEDVVAP